MYLTPAHIEVPSISRPKKGKLRYRGIVSDWRECMTDALNPEEQTHARAQSSHASGAPRSRTLSLPYGSEALQFGELHLPGGSSPYPTVILIHGGFWRAPYGYTLMTDLAEDLARRGIAAWNIEYRRIGDPGGGWPATLLDVASAADYVHAF